MGMGYALSRLVRLDFSRAFDKLNRTAEKSGKSKFWLLCDMVGSAVKYGAGPNDYELFEFYALNKEQRKTYITRGINNTLVKKFNDKSYWHLFDNKNEFNETFAEFVKRDWLTSGSMTKDEFLKFIEGKESIIYKPIDGTCGKQVEKFVIAEKNPDELFDYLKTLQNGMVEEVVKQHPEIDKVYPLAINTVRVVTIFRDGKCTPVFAFWRIGAGGHCVDNLNSGGMAAMLDTETGTVTLPAADKDGTVYESHPMTGTKIVGFTIPNWDKVIETVSLAAAKIPEVAYVGWDVCVRENDVLLIEGNQYPGHDILQLPAYTPDKIGLYPRVEKFLK